MNWTKCLRSDIFYVLTLLIIISLVPTALWHNWLASKIRRQHNRTNPPPLANIHNGYVLVSSNNFSMCEKLSTLFHEWVILFDTYDTLESATCRSLPSTAVDYGESTAFMYALSNGASVIYIFDLMSDLETMNRKSLEPFETTGLILTANGSTSYFDAGNYYGCSFGNSRGNENVRFNNTYNLCPKKTAIYMPAEVEYHGPSTRVTCDVTAPDLTMGIGVYAALVYTGAVFTETAFWAHTTFEHNDHTIVWTAMVQWLLWQTESRITVHWQGAHHMGYSLNTSDSRVLESFQMLSRMKCLGDFVQCTYYIAQQFIDSKIVSKEFATSIRQWFALLEKTGYTFPLLTQSTDSDICNDTITYFSIDFSSTPAKPKKSKHSNMPAANSVQSIELYNTICAGHVTHRKQHKQKYPKIDLSRPWTQFGDIIFIITFNTPRYETIPYLEVMYRSTFPRIVYCGPKNIDFTEYPILIHYKFIFITFSQKNSNGGAFVYECQVKVAQMNFHAKGYLFASDDVLLLPSTITKLSENSVWFYPLDGQITVDVERLKQCEQRNCDTTIINTKGGLWRKYQNQTIHALNELNSSCNVSSLLCDCHSNLVRLTGDVMRAYSTFSDIFYLPNRFMRNVSIIHSLFLRNLVFLEIALPTTLRCVSLPQDVQDVPGTQVWGPERLLPWKYFARYHMKNKMFLHPVKWSKLTELSADHLNLYCKKVVPFIYDPHKHHAF